MLSAFMRARSCASGSPTSREWQASHRYQLHFRQSMTRSPSKTRRPQPSQSPARAAQGCSMCPSKHRESRSAVRSSAIDVSSFSSASSREQPHSPVVRGEGGLSPASGMLPKASRSWLRNSWVSCCRCSARSLCTSRLPPSEAGSASEAASRKRPRASSSGSSAASPPSARSMACRSLASAPARSGSGGSGASRAPLIAAAKPGVCRRH
mmetsp:Transcript_59377/g.173689  ORF Transcript_59377/g.173689 Transcript_59377/m.173689 type:complete len:209 (-) Transcript_59377:99-725(-)